MLLRKTCVCGLFGCFFFLSWTVRAKMIAPSSGQSQMSIPGVSADNTKENNTNDRNGRNSPGWSFARRWLYFLRHQPQDKSALPSSQISHWLHHWLVCAWHKNAKKSSLIVMNIRSCLAVGANKACCTFRFLRPDLTAVLKQLWCQDAVSCCASTQHLSLLYSWL